MVEIFGRYVNYWLLGSAHSVTMFSIMLETDGIYTIHTYSRIYTQTKRLGIVRFIFWDGNVYCCNIYHERKNQKRTKQSIDRYIPTNIYAMRNKKKGHQHEWQLWRQLEKRDQLKVSVLLFSLFSQPCVLCCFSFGFRTFFSFPLSLSIRRVCLCMCVCVWLWVFRSR